MMDSYILQHHIRTSEIFSKVNSTPTPCSLQTSDVICTFAVLADSMLIVVSGKLIDEGRGLEALSYGAGSLGDIRTLLTLS